MQYRAGLVQYRAGLVKYRARFAQWWEHSPSTSVALVRFCPLRHTWFEFVSSLFCSVRFSSVFSCFPLSPKKQFSFDLICFDSVDLLSPQ